MKVPCSDLRISDLQIFYTAARLNGLGKSAIFHNISQSAASTAVQRVERSLKMNLCAHEKRIFELTPEGQNLLPKIKDFLEQARFLNLPENQFRVCMPYSIGSVCIPSLISMPEIHYLFERPDNGYAKILQNKAELAIVIDNYNWKDVLSSDVYFGFFSFFSKKTKISSTDSFLISREDREVENLKENYFKKKKKHLPVSMNITSWSVIAKVCEFSDQIGFLPDFVGKRHKLNEIDLDLVKIPYTVKILHNDIRMQFKQTFETVVNELKESFKSL